MPLIEVENLTVRYPTRRSPALREVSFSAQPGETLLLLGPSGGGKSTLALCLTGLIPHRAKASMAGSVRVAGMDTREASPGQITQQLGIVFQNPANQFATLTVADEVAFGLESLGLPPDHIEARIDGALGEVGLLDERARRLDQLSGGQQQRVALACALAMDTPALVLDEPTSHQDPAATQSLYRTLSDLKGERALILIEHKLDACIHLVDRVLLLDAQGRLTADGPPREVFSTHHDAIDAGGIWLPEVAHLALHLRPPSDREPGAGLPLRLDEAVEHFKPHLPLIASTPDEPPGTIPLDAPGARAFVVNKLSHTYPGSDDPALDEVSFSVPAGDFLALLGPNGAGKSTLAAHVAGLLPSEPGAVKLFGFDANDLSMTDRAERVGYVFQNPEHQFLTERADAEIAVSPRARQGRGRRPYLTVEQRVAEVLTQLGLEELAAASPFALSHGQQRRLSLGAMVAAAPRLLLVDEPTLGQDRHTTRRLMSLLRALNQGGTTIVLITQDMRLAAAHTRSAALLVGGKLAYHGPTRALFRQAGLLSEASLWPPELLDLSLALQRFQADFPALMTVDDFVAAFGEQG